MIHDEPRKFAARLFCYYFIFYGVDKVGVVVYN